MEEYKKRKRIDEFIGYFDGDMLNFEFVIKSERKRKNI